MEKDDSIKQGPGSIKFHVQDGSMEIMRFEPNGDIYVHGRLVENDLEVVRAFKEWLTEAGMFDKQKTSDA